MNKLIDHTFLKATGTKEDIDKLLEEAIEFEFKSVCVQPTWVSYVAESLKKSDVLTCTVIGFPLGANTTETKVYETLDALKKGADEIDMVANIGWLLAGEYDKFAQEVKALKETCQSHVLKVILETCYLDPKTISRASEKAFEAGADFVKTSTGFGPAGATVEAVKLMAAAANGKGVKASGGVRTLADVEAMVAVGATRIGTSNGVTIIQGQEAKESY